MTGKRKDDSGRELPVRVYRTKTSFVWKPRDNQTLKLCPIDTPISEVWRRWEQLRDDEVKKRSVNWLVAEFLRSADFQELAPATRKDYFKHSKPVLAVFGKMEPSKVEPRHVRMYMDKRGLSSRVQANREKAFFSRVFRWAYERGLVTLNPCKGVRQFKEQARTKYITDAEYNAVYQDAPIAVKVAMEIAYLCCARQADVLTLRKGQLLPEGIFMQQGKTGKEQIKAWSPRLSAAISLAKTLPIKSGMASQYVIHKSDGCKYVRDGFNSAWSKARAAARLRTGMPLDFTFHDIKAKGVSDLNGGLYEKQRITGHKSASQTARYDRKTDVVQTVDGFNSNKIKP